MAAVRCREQRPAGGGSRGGSHPAFEVVERRCVEAERPRPAGLRSLELHGVADLGERDLDGQTCCLDVDVAVAEREQLAAAHPGSEGDGPQVGERMVGGDVEEVAHLRGIPDPQLARSAPDGGVTRDHRGGCGVGLEDAEADRVDEAAVQDGVGVGDGPWGERSTAAPAARQQPGVGRLDGADVEFVERDLPEVGEEVGVGHDAVGVGRGRLEVVAARRRPLLEPLGERRDGDQLIGDVARNVRGQPGVRSASPRASRTRTWATTLLTERSPTSAPISRSVGATPERSCRRRSAVSTSRCRRVRSIGSSSSRTAPRSSGSREHRADRGPGADGSFQTCGRSRPWAVSSRGRSRPACPTAIRCPQAGAGPDSMCRREPAG